MTKNFKILAQYIKDMSSETPDIQSYMFVKENISKYLNEFRIIGDNYNILDVPVFNFGLNFKIRVKAGFNVDNVMLDVNSRIVEHLRFDLYQIGTAINVNNITRIIESTDGVATLMTPKKSIVLSRSTEDTFFDRDIGISRTYNNNIFNPQTLFDNGLVYPPRGGIFEMKYTFQDIKIAAN